MMQALKDTPLVRATSARALRLMCLPVEAYVFVATTGRSGTMTLANVLESVPGSAVFHEPDPIMYSDRLDGSRDAALDQLFWQRKRIAVHRSALGRRYYIETNHQFIKSFADPAVKWFGSKLRVIHLRRDPVGVASSFYRMQSIPGVSRRGKLWLLDPRSPDNLVQVGDALWSDARFQHDYYKCLWYWFETEARVDAFRRMHPSVPTGTIETSQLNDLDRVRALLQELGVAYDDQALRGQIGKRHNEKADDVQNVINRAEAVKMTENFRELLASRCGSIGYDFRAAN